MASTNYTLSKINIFATLSAFLSHSETTIGDDELSLIGSIGIITDYSLGESGYIKFTMDNVNFLIQWGKTSLTSATTTTVTFPIAFPTACVNVQNTHIYANASASSGGDNNDVVSVPTATSFILRGGNGVGQFWVAFGY